MLGQSAPQSLMLGQLGSLYVESGNTDAHTGDWGILYAIMPTVFATIISGVTLATGGAITIGTNGSGTLSNVPLPAGVAIYGRFASFTLTSGSIFAYRL